MSPNSQAGGFSAEGDSTTLGPITPIMVAHLRATKPWVRLLSIVGFVGSALILVLALVLPFVGPLSRELGGAVGRVALAIGYLLLGCLYFFPSLFLFRYASAIRSLLITGDSASMELALSYQKSFWRLVGIAMLVVLCLYGVLLLVLVVVGIGSVLT